MIIECRLRALLRCNPQGSQDERKEVLLQLQSALKGKTIIDVTTASYLKDESKWGQTSTTHMNAEALAAPAKWVRCWNTVFVVRLLFLCQPLHTRSMAVPLLLGHCWPADC